MDKKIFLFLNSLAGQNFLVDQFIYFSAVILPWLTILIFIVWIIFQKSWRKIIKGMLVFASASVAWFLTSLFKYNYFSPRPFVEIFQFQPLFTMNIWWDSLPSSHAVFFSALAGSSFLFKKKAVSFCLILVAIIIAFARVIAGVHWPSDVVAGLVFGGIIGYFLAKGLDKVFFKP